MSMSGKRPALLAASPLRFTAANASAIACRTGRSADVSLRGTLTYRVTSTAFGLTRKYPLDGFFYGPI
jgi:hypothetical protein